MPIQPSAVPPAAVDALAATLNRRTIDDSFVTRRLARQSGKSLQYSTPHVVAYLALEAMRPGHEIRSRVSKIAWRFLLHGEDRELLAAATVVSRGERNWTLNEIAEGPFIDGTATAIARAEAMARVAEGSFDLALVVAPAIQVVALWLKDRDAADDFLLPLPPTHSRLGAFEPTSPSRFLEVATHAAQRLRYPQLGLPGASMRMRRPPGDGSPPSAA